MTIQRLIHVQGYDPEGIRLAWVKDSENLTHLETHRLTIEKKPDRKVLLKLNGVEALFDALQLFKIFDDITRE